MFLPILFGISPNSNYFPSQLDIEMTARKPEKLFRYIYVYNRYINIRKTEVFRKYNSLLSKIL